MICKPRPRRQGLLVQPGAQPSKLERAVITVTVAGRRCGVGRGSSHGCKGLPGRVARAARPVCPAVRLMSLYIVHSLI